MGIQLPSSKGAEPPIFGPNLLLDVLCPLFGNGDPAPLPKNGARQLSAYVCCGQTARWIKMPLGTEVGLDSGDIVLDGDPLPQKGHAPDFRPMSIVAKRLNVSGYHLVWR